MTIYFVTGSTHKLHEIRTIIPEVKQLDIDLPEIQHIDAQKIIEAKLDEAFKHHQGPLIVEDTSLYVDILNGLPGPLVKWFLATIGTEGLYAMAKSMGDVRAKVETIIGYGRAEGDIQFFTGTLQGKLVAPRGDNGFGYDEVFEPDGHSQTLAQMDSEQKSRFSMRALAATQLRQYLDKTKV